MSLQLSPIPNVAGVDKDNTPFNTQHYTDANGIRFYLNSPQKIGGWDQIVFDNGNAITGVARTLYSQRIGNNLWSLIGTNTRLYCLVSTSLTNITPLVTDTTAIANSLSTNYTTLGSNPITTVIHSTTITIAHTAHKLQTGDSVTFSGATTTNGVPDTDINITHVVRSTTTNSYTVTVATAATSSGSGGGASVIEKTAIISVAQVAHGFLEGDRIAIAAATSTGGIPDTEINAEHIIRDVTTNAYDFVCTTKATSSVTGGGGASTTVRGQIAAGAANASYGIGYGEGLYGAGTYGTPKMAASTLMLPRIYSFDAFGNNVILTPGSQTGTYQWTGSDATAPEPLTNAPTAINYVFTLNNIIVTMGDSNVPNRLKWSDLGNSTVWTSAAANFAGEDDIEGAGIFMSHAQIGQQIALLYTPNQLYTFQFIGLPDVWQTQKISDSAGILAQGARVSYQGIAYWISNGDFLMYNGGTVQPIPSNTGQNYLRNWFFSNISQTQYSKAFAWFNPKYSEIWFHAPSALSNECDIVARYSVTEKHWTPDIMSRSCAEYPNILQIYPKLFTPTGSLYRHEKGLNDVDSPLDWSLTGPLFQAPQDLTEIGGVIPDSTQTGDITFDMFTQLYPQSASITTTTSTVSPATEQVTNFANGRNWKFRFSQTDVLDGYWRMGQWQQYVQPGTYS